MVTGTVKWFDSDRGFGYLCDDEGGPDVFVHRSAIVAGKVEAIQEGRPVEFEVEMTGKGPKAVSVTPLGD